MYMSGAHPVHMKEVTLTELRRNIFRLVDEALETGESIVVKRHGRTVTLAPDARPTRGRKLAPDDKEGWAKFWAEPSPLGWENYDLSFEALDKAGKSFWEWDGEPELDT
jgi:antitoxin (DNA-binding transcriptional repressor) of toxin-antitoxin stability system